LTFDLLTSGSMHVERLLWSICVPSLVLIAQAVFLLQRGQTDRETEATKRRTKNSGYTAGVKHYVAKNKTGLICTFNIPIIIRISMYDRDDKITQGI